MWRIKSTCCLLYMERAMLRGFFSLTLLQCDRHHSTLLIIILQLHFYTILRKVGDLINHSNMVVIQEMELVIPNRLHINIYKDQGEVRRRVSPIQLVPYRVLSHGKTYKSSAQTSSSSSASSETFYNSTDIRLYKF